MPYQECPVRGRRAIIKVSVGIVQNDRVKSYLNGMKPLNSQAAPLSDGLQYCCGHKGPLQWFNLRHLMQGDTPQNNRHQ